ncbi:hypothetical protein ACGFI9_12085 [Micromonospora sp. NPDC048930]|uniref:hypothetical protein n=1 Tax=Micromonospora sp. NPDC048930 TaxID=3364261 RepID=UPI003710E85E
MGWDPAVVGTTITAGSALAGTLSGLWLGRRQRRATLADLETNIAERLMIRMDKELADALADVDRLRTEVDGLRKRLDAQEARERELLAELATVRGERDRARGEATQLRAQLAAKEAELAARVAEVTDLKSLIAHGQAAASGGPAATR